MSHWINTNTNFKNQFQLLALLLVLVLVSSCTPNKVDEINRSVSVFILGMFQIFNMLLLGIPSLVFSIICASNGKKIFKILGIVFVSLFAALGLIGFIAVINVPPRHFHVFFIFIIELAMIAGSVVSIVLGARKKQMGNLYDSESTQDILDI